MGGLNSAAEPQAHGVSVQLLFNLQHWSTIPFGRGRGLPIRDHDPPGEAVGKDSANSSGNACSPDETEEVIGCYSLSIHYRLLDSRIHAPAVSGYAWRAPFVND